MGSAVKIPDLKSAPPGFINTSQRFCRSVVETNFPQGFSSASSAWRVLTPQGFPLAPAPSERVPQSPALVRVVRVDPALLAGLPLSTDPPYLPNVFWPTFSENQVGRQQVRGMLAAVGRVAILRAAPWPKEYHRN